MISDIRTKAICDTLKDGRGIIDEAREYVDAEPGKFFHVVMAAKFKPDFKGVLRLEVTHAKSGFRTYTIVASPPKHILEGSDNEVDLCFSSYGIPINILLGRNYRPVPGQCDTVTVKLFLDNKEISTKELLVRGTAS